MEWKRGIAVCNCHYFQRWYRNKTSLFGKWDNQAGKKVGGTGKKPEQKRKYISEEEHEKCKKVVSAFEKELDDIEVLVVDAGRLGFVKLIYYKYPDGFDDAMLFTDSFELFLIYGTNGLTHNC